MLEDENSQENTTTTGGLSIEATQSRQVLNKFSKVLDYVSDRFKELSAGLGHHDNAVEILIEEWRLARRRRHCD